MPTDDLEYISDPQRVRALTHPIRLRLIDYLGKVADATATECAESVGESVASCSFHLRMLAKYGFIDRAPSRGREKPWRLVARSQSTRPDFDDTESVQAVAALAVTHLEYQIGLMRTWLERDAHRVEPEWANATTQTSSSMWLTRDELAEISQTIITFSDRFAGRWENPSERPEGSRPVRLFATTFLDPASETSTDESESR